MNKKLEAYAAQNGINYNELLIDYLNETPENQNEFMMQIGGQPEMQGGEQEELMQIIQMFAEMNGISVEEIIQQLEQMQPEEQEQAIQQMVEAVQSQMGDGQQEQMQQGGENEVMQMLQMYAEQNGIAIEELIQQLESLPEEKQQEALQEIQASFQQSQQEMKQGGIPMNSNGYYELDPIEDPYALIPSGDITTDNLDFDLNAYDGRTGKFLQRMKPNNNYNFDTDLVLEEPIIAQTGTRKINFAGGFLELTEKDIEKIKQSFGKNYTNKKYLDVVKFLKNKSNLKKDLKPDLSWLNTAPNYQDKNTSSSNSKPTPKGSTSKSSSPTSKGKWKPLTGADEWTQKWEKFLVQNGTIDGDKKYSVDEIDDYVYDFVNKNKDIYKDNKYINDANFEEKIKDGMYGIKHASLLPPEDNRTYGDINLKPIERGKTNPLINIEKRFSGLNNPIAKLYPKLDANGDPVSTTAANTEEAEEDTPNLANYTFNTRSPLKAMLLGNQVNRAYRPIDLPYRPTLNYAPIEMPELDATPYVNDVVTQTNAALKNINPNSTAGQSVMSNLYANSLDNILKLTTEINRTNTDIRAKNENAKIDAITKTIEYSNNSNMNYVKELQAAEAARDAGIDASSNALQREISQQEYNKQILDDTLMRNPFLEENTSNLDKVLGRRNITQNKDIQFQLFNEQLKREQELAAKEKAKKQYGGLNSFFKNKYLN